MAGLSPHSVFSLALRDRRRAAAASPAASSAPPLLADPMQIVAAIKQGTAALR